MWCECVCSVSLDDPSQHFKKLDNFLSQVPDDPRETNSDNSIAGTALRQSWCLQRDVSGSVISRILSQI